MNRRDRAQLVVAEIESRGTEGEPVTPQLVEDVIRRNALGESELPALHREVIRLLDKKGYDVEVPDQEAAWALVGALVLVFWVLATLAVARLIGVV